MDLYVRGPALGLTKKDKGVQGRDVKGKASE